jgi:hypothetical protein
LLSVVLFYLMKNTLEFSRVVSNSEWTSLSASPICKPNESIVLDCKLLSSSNKSPSQQIEKMNFTMSAHLTQPKDTNDTTAVHSVSETPTPQKTAKSIVLFQSKGEFEGNLEEITIQIASKQKNLVPILKKNISKATTCEEIIMRVDKQGVAIDSIGKKHTITFHTKIHTVVLVENWKDHNKMPTTTTCTCNLF